MEQKEKRMENLARELLEDGRDSLVLSLRFMDKVLFRMPMDPAENGSIGTDMQQIYFNPYHLLKSFKNERNAPARDLLHLILHLVLAHPFNREDKDTRLWDLAVDMAVEKIILQLELGICTTHRDVEERKVLEDFEKKGISLTGENVYRELTHLPMEETKLCAMEELFYRDDHGRWEESLARAYAKEWRELSQQVKMDLETYSKEILSKSGALAQNLRQAYRDKVNYRDFLRKFAVLREEMKINDDEFDYVFYTYGLELYKNMPLIEPLEYAEEVRIKDFVIALDTSGSCSGELINLFLSKTYSILKSTGSYFRKVNIYIVQSDNQIQQVIRITTPEEFEEYLKNFQAIGLGGTDFRPVFSFVDQLVESGELENLKGLIYFTDGYGRFPAKKPSYDTAFVFVEEETEPKVPSWAIKITLEEQELRT